MFKKGNLTCLRCAPHTPTQKRSPAAFPSCTPDDRLPEPLKGAVAPGGCCLLQLPEARARALSCVTSRFPSQPMNRHRAQLQSTNRGILNCETRPVDEREPAARRCGFLLISFGWSRSFSPNLTGLIMKDGMANNSTASISQARKAVEQLKMEACMDRIKVSKAAADLMAYCDAHIREDPLIVPVPASENPFREKKFFCNIL
ncbi:hypothetical protein DNTS_026790 [Danionella cerebrum]|uniref:Guanine nucleotide-binding protein subunit gamma n=1 Tax=Danionella cerebrum TaxID=2873325 RepID=A0A553NGL1_9TELE|nr:hypothetical protein DNTS_026790 [Danionella translucida]